jgi:malate synthase
MTQRINQHGLKVAAELEHFITSEALPGTGIDADTFWRGFSKLVHDLTPINRALLDKRDALQRQIDDWYLDNPGATDPAAQEKFLRQIGYIVPEGADFKIDVRNVDAEISSIAGPQLVVPVMNARYALNAANARWGSLYDALYGTDAISEKEGAQKSKAYNPVRGAKVIAWARDFLNRYFPLSSSDWLEITSLPISAEQFKSPSQFAGTTVHSDTSTSIYLRNNGLLVEVLTDSNSDLAKQDMAGISDIRLEAAMTVIMDCEDSVAAVDAEDKTTVYRNWLGLMRGDLQEVLDKNGQTITRKLHGNHHFTTQDGAVVEVKARSLMLIRNVGHLMTTPAILDRSGQEIPEGLMDAMVTTLIALHDIGPKGLRANSQAGSMYVVKPKMHGPEEVAFAVRTFDQVEDVLGLARNSVKLGIMDEERRTTVNLKECIRVAQNRIVFINTGFLDRTGDEMHTAMEAGPMLRKGDMKTATWIKSYEDWNVDTGLACGFSGVAQIGKGMWAMPDLMAAMLEQKIAHPKAGANTAWVPSPTGATLHATHYHAVNVHDVQQQLLSKPRASLAGVLSIPVAVRPNWTDEDIQRELDNNAQGILGYVVRWVNDGIGCSKVPDINNVGLMEDRATLRISAQHMANWLHHGVVKKKHIKETMMRMAAIVDKQNAGDPNYAPMSGHFDTSIAFHTACDLVFKGREQPNGYTEPLLHAARLRVKTGG